MTYRDLNDNDLADFAAHLEALLSGTELPAIDSNVRAELIAALGTMPADLSQQKAAAVAMDNEKKAAFVTKDETRARIEAWVARVVNALKTGVAPKDQFTKAGFNYRSRSSSPYVAQDPTALSASGFSNGVNKGRFSGNNNPGAVIFEIWRRQGTDGIWMLPSTSKKQSFKDNSVTPGQYYEYRVRAVATRSISNFSNSTIVYGVL